MRARKPSSQAPKCIPRGNAVTKTSRTAAARPRHGTEFAVKQKDMIPIEEGDEAATTNPVSEPFLQAPAPGAFVPVAEDITSSWICCDKCQKWRRIPDNVPVPDGEVEWTCEMNDWDGVYNQCWVQEEPGAREPDIHEESSPINFDDKINEAELSVIEGIGAETIWALSTGRLICWVEEKPYAVAHEGETLNDLATSFNSILRCTPNVAIDNRLKISSVFCCARWCYRG